MANAVEVVIKAIDSTKGGITSALKNMDTFKGAAVGLGIAASAMAATWLAAAGVLTKSAIDAASELGTLSKQTGISVESLSRLSGAAKLSGVDLETFVVMTKHLNKALAEAVATPTSDAAKAIRAMGLSALDASGNMVKADVFIKQLSDRFSSYADGPNKVAIALTLMGRNGTEAIAFLDKGSAKIEELGSKVSTVTTEESVQAKEFNSVMKELNLAFSNLGNELAKELLPTLTSVAKTFKSFISDKNEDGVSLITASVMTLTHALRDLKQATESTPESILMTEGNRARQMNNPAVTDAIRKSMQAPSTPSTSGSGDAPSINAEENAKKLADLERSLKNEKLDGMALLEATQKEHYISNKKRIEDLNLGDSDNFRLNKIALEAQIEASKKAESDGSKFRADLSVAESQGKMDLEIKLLDSKSGIRNLELQKNQEMINLYVDQWRLAHASIKSFATSMFSSFSSNFGSAIGEVLRNFHSAGDAAKKFGDAMINSVTNFIGQWIASRLTMLAMSAIFGQTAVATLAPVALQMSSLLSTPATLASVASFGAADAIGVAALAGALTAGKAMSAIGGVAHGGLDYVPQESTFLLKKGEAVLQPSANVALMDFLGNQGGQGPTMVELHIDGEVLGRGIGRMSKDGRLVISARSIT